jgi:hypothetical protein
MLWIRSSPIFAGWLAVCALCAAAGAGWVNHLRHSARREVAVLTERQEARARLIQENPAPTAENESAIEDDLAEAEQNLADLMATRQGDPGTWHFAPLPGRPIDAYFEIASFVEQMRALAGSLQVPVKPDEHFSFAAYANEGPDAAHLTEVSRQRQIVQRLLEALFAARPQEFLAVQRERLPVAASRNARPAPTARTTAIDSAVDYFTSDPRLALRAAGAVESRMFRLEFTGQTPALRAFLNSLALSPMPLVVRSVEVEPLNSRAGNSPAAAPPAAAEPPLIAQSYSRFAVVVEFAEPANPPNLPMP